jgi:hypothetical protein
MHRCFYCGRSAVRTWDDDLLTCDREICKGLAFREIVARNRRGARTRWRPQPPSPELAYAAALLKAERTIEYLLRRDLDGEVLDRREYAALLDSERRATAGALLAAKRALGTRAIPLPRPYEPALEHLRPAA